MDTVDINDSKAREFLPDILTHLDHMREKQKTLLGIIRSFESEWSMGGVDTSKNTPEDGKPMDQDMLSTVDEVYMSMKSLEDGFNALNVRLNILREQYLGETLDKPKRV